MVKISEINSLNFKIINNYKSLNPVFKADTENQQDTVELSTKKDKNLSKTQKNGLVVAASLLGLALGGAIFVKGLHKKIEKLYNEKLKLTDLPEKIEFKTAEKLEDAINFAKNILGIKEIIGLNNLNKEEALAGLNYVNKSIVDVSNLNKGKLYMPPTLDFAKISNKKTIATMDIGIHSKEFGRLTVNCDYLDKKKLDDYLRTNLYRADGTQLLKLNAKNNEYVSNIAENKMIAYFKEEVTPFFNKYYSNPDSLTFSEKMILRATLDDKLEAVSSMNRYPMIFMEKNKNLFEEVGINVNMEEFKKMDRIEQSKYIKNLLGKRMNEHNKITLIAIGLGSPEKNIYHELGHLQDAGKNLKEIDLKMFDTNNYRLIFDRFGSLSDKENKDVWDKDKTKNKENFKELFPELYEFLTNNEIQETAGKVSTYSQTGIAEFIAETYALVVDSKLHGKTIPEDIMKLYVKYNGPMLP